MFAKEKFPFFCDTIMDISHRKRAGGPGVSIAEVFWDITLDGAGRGGGPLADELGNLPAWDSPDVFADSCDLIGMRGKKNREGNFAMLFYGLLLAMFRFRTYEDPEPDPVEMELIK
jgi:hypothetical protein